MKSPTRQLVELAILLKPERTAKMPMVPKERGIVWNILAFPWRTLKFLVRMLFNICYWTCIAVFISITLVCIPVVLVLQLFVKVMELGMPPKSE